MVKTRAQSRLKREIVVSGAALLLRIKYRAIREGHDPAQQLLIGMEILRREKYTERTIKLCCNLIMIPYLNSAPLSDIIGY
jgi:hypothetical protein